MKFLPIILLLTLMISCSTKKNIDVKQFGEIETLMKRGDMSGHFNLKDLPHENDIYGFGSLKDLQGYTQVVNGKPYTYMVDSGSIVVDSTLNHEATLFLYEEVKSWKEFPIAPDLKNFQEVQNYVKNIAEEENWNTKGIIPFLITGNVKSLDWQVVDWTIGDKEITYNKELNSGITTHSENIPCTILGYYCDDSYEIFAHHSLNMHLHFVSADHSLGGHVKELSIGGNMTMKLLLPDTGK